MNDILRIARLRIALQRAFLGRAILRVIDGDYVQIMVTTMFVRIYILYTNKKKNMNNREEGFYLHGYHYVP